MDIVEDIYNRLLSVYGDIDHPSSDEKVLISVAVELKRLYSALNVDLPMEDGTGLPLCGPPPKMPPVKPPKMKPRYSGSRECNVCGDRRPFSEFLGGNECMACQDEALSTYHVVLNAISSLGNHVLLPSMEAYINDYLDRKIERMLR